jgi:4a-hydroxytetrahydrobiopterin dehydratase
MKTSFNNLRIQARKLLFEDVYPEYSNSSWADGERAGTQFVEDAPEDENPLDTPINPQPQMATQLSADEPPVDDPEYTPTGNQSLASALYTLALKLPDDTAVAEKTFQKFRKFVDDHEEIGVELVDAGDDSVEEEEVTEARKIIRNHLLISLLSESNWDEFELAGHEEDEDDWDGPSDEDLEAIDRGDPHAGEMTLGQIAAEMGLSTSGVKRLEAEALKNYRLIYDVAPEAMDKIVAFSVPFFADALVELDLITHETSEWLVHEQPERLVRQYSFEDVKVRNWFLREVLEEENNSGHFGKITIDGLSVLMEVWTHDVDAVTELDVEYAHRCDDIFGDVDLLGGAGYGY